MGGPGTERATRHKLNGVPHNVGHGDHILVIGEPAGACRCYHHNHTPNDPIIHDYLSIPHDITTSISNLTLDTINNNHQEVYKTTKFDSDCAKTTMSSPPKHRRGFDPSDTTGGGDYRRYRRVKTRKCFVCYHRDVGRWSC
ncbi:uncharacterized protein [Fopius arisanus]|uniref:Uncharacterized protein n=1 Tax=Fopius arisanus TaxID=64838 RepID=A0A0C9RK21_9HYME|nr:PREDICTED: uncharacterized protein LOC105263227 [Fopius arisanus]XP_011297587.1 PREDICTED: uncharacterized protein LOC105263227 [Fopius arisanus]XP_011297588.1 PREDICTED: uncharacterized protein LOC105263227 [Fopius arisanus]